ncbi:MAG: VOC family protein [Pseudomonadota bacterium]
MTVSMKRLDHVNVRTADLEGMIDWYGRMLGMHPGDRPDFPFPGAWLYADGHAIIHLVGTEAEPANDGKDLRLEHFAIAATGLRALLDRAASAGERAEVRPVPGFPIVQVNMWDPDGNHIHIDFDEAEAEGLAIG